MTFQPWLVTDLDGTLFREALLVLFFRHAFRLGLLDGGVEAEFEAMYRRHRDRIVEHRDFDHEFLGFYFRHIVKIPVVEIERCAEESVGDNEAHVYRFTRELIRRCAGTHRRMIITTTLGELARAVQRRFGIDEVYASEGERRNGYFTDRDSVSVDDKGQVLLAHAVGNDLRDAIVIGDTATDASMLALARYPIAFRPNYELAMIAEREKWPIVEEGKGKVTVRLCGIHRTFRIDEANAAIDETLRLSPVRP